MSSAFSAAMREFRRFASTSTSSVQARSAGPGKRTLTGQVQRHASVQQVAAEGVAGASTSLPHGDAIQRSFGPGHRVAGILAHVGGPANAAAEAIGAEAYATGDRAAFRESPDLHTAAHEAAHVVQQRQGVQLRGGVGEPGDAYERHADAVADRVVAGESAADLLGVASGSSDGPAVQRKGKPPNNKPHDLTRDQLLTMSAPGGGGGSLLDDDQVSSAIAWNTKHWHGHHREQILEYLRGGPGGDLEFSAEDVQMVAELQAGAGLGLDEASGWIGQKTSAILLNAGLFLDSAANKDDVKARDVHLTLYPGELEDIEEWKRAKEQAIADHGDEPNFTEYESTIEPQGVGKMYVEYKGAIVAVIDVRGGPPIKLNHGPDHTAAPSTPGEYTLAQGKPHRTDAWYNSQIRWGAEIREHDHEIEFRDPGERTWKIATGKRSDLATPMERDDFLEGGAVVTEWKKNEFGPISWNLRRKGKKTAMYVHTTEDDEKDTVNNLDPTLACSHGCLHVKPAQRDLMMQSGYFQKGVKLTIKKYPAHLLPEAMRNEMVK